VYLVCQASPPGGHVRVLLLSRQNSCAAQYSFSPGDRICPSPALTFLSAFSSWCEERFVPKVVGRFLKGWDEVSGIDPKELIVLLCSRDTLLPP